MSSIPCKSYLSLVQGFFALIKTITVTLTYSFYTAYIKRQPWHSFCVQVCKNLTLPQTATNQTAKCRSRLTYWYIKYNFVTFIHPKCYSSILIVLIEKCVWKWPWGCQRIGFAALALLHALNNKNKFEAVVLLVHIWKCILRNLSILKYHLQDSEHNCTLQRALCTVAIMYIWVLSVLF